MPDLAHLFIGCHEPFRDSISIIFIAL